MNRTLRTFHIRHEALQDLSERLKGPMTAEHFGQILDASTRIFRRDGTLLGVLLRDAMPLLAGGAMYRAVVPILKAKSVKSPGPVNMGLWESPGGGYAPTPFTSLYPKAADSCAGALNHLASLYKTHASEQYQAQIALMEYQGRRQGLGGSPFSSVAMSMNLGGKYHQDTATHPKHMRVLSCFRGGKQRPSHVVLPAYSLALTLDSLDVLFLASHEAYGLNGLEGAEGTYERIVCDHTLRAVGAA